MAGCGWFFGRRGSLWGSCGSFHTVAHMCKTPHKKLLHPRDHKTPQYANQIATVNLKHPPKDSKHPPKDSKHPQKIRNTPKYSKHPKIFETPQKIRNTPKHSEHYKRFETPQKIRNTPKDSKHPKIFVIQVLLNKKFGNIITIIKFANEVQ